MVGRSRRSAFAALVLAGAFAGAQAPVAAAEARAVPGELIVGWEAGVTQRARTAALAREGAADIGETILPGGPAVTVTMATPGQNAILTFAASAGQSTKLRLSSVTVGTSSCCSLRLSVLKPDGTRLVYPSYVGRNGATVALALPASGTYTVLLDPQNADTGSVTLRSQPPETG